LKRKFLIPEKNYAYKKMTKIYREKSSKSRGPRSS